MSKKKPVTLSSPPTWDPASKEPWLLEFEKEPVNDKRWICIVTAAVPSEYNKTNSFFGYYAASKSWNALPHKPYPDVSPVAVWSAKLLDMAYEAQDDDTIQIFNQCAATGTRRAIKTISMSDVVGLLKGKGDSKNEGKKNNVKKPKNGKTEKSQMNENLQQEYPSIGSKIIDLAGQYATFTDVECRLPPDLMAIVIKYQILNMKKENCMQKKIQIAKARRERQWKIKQQFIRDLKPYEALKKSGTIDSKKVVQPDSLDLQEISDEPEGGPDLYILLSDFYDPFYFTELQKINVPFVALFKITSVREIGKGSHTSVPEKKETAGKKGPLLAKFWENLKQNCQSLENTMAFKDIAMMQYQEYFNKNINAKNLFANIFDELSWMQYSAYYVHRQHQNYLKELTVQRLIVSLEPLDLEKCEVYNKLCDALITGEPNTPYLVLYAIIEQVVAGVPYTESVPFDYEPKIGEPHSSDSQLDTFSVDTLKFFEGRNYDIVTPCPKCRNKKPDVCDAWEKRVIEESVSEKGEWSDNEDKKGSVDYKNLGETSLPSIFSEEFEKRSEEYRISPSLLNQVLSEKYVEKKKKKGKTPMVYLFGDSINIQSYHCDTRLIDPDVIFDRFLKNWDIPRFWMKYPELPPEQRAFYNFHFFTLWKMSNERQDLLRLKIFFVLSMKLIGIAKSYLYRGEDENTSETFWGGAKEKLKKLSKVRFDRNASAEVARGDGGNFSNYFLKTFIVDMHFRAPRKTAFKRENVERIRGSLVKTDSHNLRKVTSQFNIYLVSHRSSGTCYPYCYKTFGSLYNESCISDLQSSEESITLSSLLDCFEISNITEPHVLNDKDAYFNLIQDFNYFEELDPRRMVQRMIEAQDNYNTVQCSYFAPTDTLILNMCNDFDYRGVFFTYGQSSLPTPVALRDFYTYAYPEISEWLMDEDSQYIKFATELQEKRKKKEEKEDSEYLSLLKKQYCGMTEQEKDRFLENGLVPEKELEFLESDLEELCIKPKPNYSIRNSFITTNILEVRVETRRHVHEFYSKDGTEISVNIDSWLYEHIRLLTLSIKKSFLKLIYYRWLGEEKVNTSFILRTPSDIIFGFYKTLSEERNNTFQPSSTYRVKISWPTGLLIEGVPFKKEKIYIKQGYLKVYRRQWDLEEEKCRCYLKNGQILIFKENGHVEVFCASGAKFSLQEFKKPKSEDNLFFPLLVSKFEFTTTTGEVWEKLSKGPCRNKRKLINTYKVYIGVDPKTQETFYRREDGVHCMLWPNGRLVTTFPDGTKITSTPDFDREEINVEWTNEEKLLYMQSESTLKDAQQQPRSKTILRKINSRLSGTENQNGSFSQTDGFISVSCSYLMEHPKYATVHFKSSDPHAAVKMFDDLTINISPENFLQVRHGPNALNIKDDKAEFYTSCDYCDEESKAILYLTSEEIICKFFDFFRNVFFIYNNGETTLEENTKFDDDKSLNEEPKELENNSNNTHCNHAKNIANNQRCFALERDLSGFEFIHSDFVANDCFYLPDDTHYDLDIKSADEIITSHTFSSPYYKVGYENWLMEYEDTGSSLPTNLKKKDLREQGVKENPNKLYTHPFPKKSECNNNRNDQTLNSTIAEMPKMIIARIIKSFNQQPRDIIGDLQKYVNAYQKRARDICNKYKRRKSTDDRSQEFKNIKTKLRKIALTLSPSLNSYSHLCSQIPSTEQEVHYFGHLINTMEELKPHFDKEFEKWNMPDCKQIPRRLPRNSNLDSIHEETNTPRNNQR